MTQAEAKTIAQLSALAQKTRLSVFRQLIRAGSEGIPAGRIAESLGVAPNTLSAHLSILSRAELIDQRRQGRSIIYFAAIPEVADLVDALINDCCAGHPEACAPILNSRSDLVSHCGA